MLTRDKCYSSLVNATPEQCRRYLYECLLEGDENSVQVCLDMRLIGHNGKSFYKVSENEINEMPFVHRIYFPNRHTLFQK